MRFNVVDIVEPLRSHYRSIDPSLFALRLFIYESSLLLALQGFLQTPRKVPSCRQPGPQKQRGGSPGDLYPTELVLKPSHQISLFINLAPARSRSQVEGEVASRPRPQNRLVHEQGVASRVTVHRRSAGCVVVGGAFPTHRHDAGDWGPRRKSSQ